MGLLSVPYAQVQVFRYRDGRGRSMLAVREWCRLQARSYPDVTLTGDL